jgi:hypothetical protein
MPNSQILAGDPAQRPLHLSIYANAQVILQTHQMLVCGEILLKQTFVCILPIVVLQCLLSLFQRRRLRMPRWNYVHADQVLPTRLVKEIRQYATGLIYIPTDQALTSQRTAIRIRALKEQGFRNCQIARILDITPRHVCGVLRRFQEAKGMTTPAGTIPGDVPPAGHGEGGETPPSPRL